MTVGALVVGGDYRGLGIVRSLGRRGIPVHVAYRTDTIAVHSRYCAGRYRLPDSGAAVVEFLTRIARERGLTGWVLFPTSDETAALVSRYASVLGESYRLTTPAWDRYRFAADKRSALAAAAAAEVATPRTWFPSNEQELDGLPLPFPVIVKPSIRTVPNELTDAKAWRADDREALRRHYRRAVALMPAREVMVQELIPGGGDLQLAFGTVCRSGRPAGRITVCRLRQYPAEFGRASTAVVTVHRPDVEDAAVRLLAALAVDGPVEVEFKHDPRDGLPKLLDVNLRVWGWHSIGAAAGVDIAHSAYLAALGRPTPTTDGACDVRWVRLGIDLPVALREIVAGRLAASAYLRSVRHPLSGPISARDDPWPSLWDPLLLARAAFARAAH